MDAKANNFTIDIDDIKKKTIGGIIQRSQKGYEKGVIITDVEFDTVLKIIVFFGWNKKGKKDYVMVAATDIDELLQSHEFTTAGFTTSLWI